MIWWYDDTMRIQGARNNNKIKQNYKHNKKKAKTKKNNQRKQTQKL